MNLFGGRKEEVAVVFDIGSGSIGATLVLLSNRDVPSLIFNVRAPITVSGKPDEKGFIRAMYVALDSVINSLTDSGLKHLEFTGLRQRRIKSIIVTFTSPWFLPQTRHVRYVQESPFEVTDRMLEEVVEQEINKVVHGDEVKKYLGTDEPARIIDKRLIHTRINGYETSKPDAKRGTELEARIFLALASEELLTSIEAKLDAAFGVRGIHFFSFPLVAYSTIRQIYAVESNLVVADISGEMIDVVLAENGALEEVKAIPIGKNTFVRSVAESFGTDVTETLSLLRMYTEQSTDKKISEKIERVCGDVFQKTAEDLSMQLERQFNTSVLPRQLIVLADPDLIRSIARFTARNPRDECTLGTHTFAPVFITDGALDHYVRLNKGVRLDVFTVLNAIYFNTLISHI